MKKRLLPSLLAVVMLLSLLPATVFAADTTAATAATATTPPPSWTLDVEHGTAEPGKIDFTVRVGTTWTNPDDGLIYNVYAISEDTAATTFALSPTPGYKLKATPAPSIVDPDFPEDNLYGVIFSMEFANGKAYINLMESESFGLSVAMSNTIKISGLFEKDPDYVPPETGNNGGDNSSDNNSGGGSGGGGGGSDSASTPTTSGSTTTVDMTTNSTTSGTTANATVTASSMNSAVDSAIAEAAKQGTAPVVEIKVTTSSRADSLDVTLPVASLKTLAESNNGSLVVSSSLVNITLNNAALDALIGQATGGNVSLEFAPVAASSLSSAQQAAVGSATVVDLSLLNNGAAIHDFQGGQLTVSLPYTLPAGQSASGVTVFYLGNDGSLEACRTSFASGKVTFSTSHLSKYVIGDASLASQTTTSTTSTTFTDVPANAYYANAVAWAAENGVAYGTGSTYFSPDLGCTRAQFVTFLWRAAGSPSSAGAANKFSDVSETAHAGYYNAILWAVANGITAGTGDGSTFSPDAVVTRAQAVTFMCRYAQKAGIATKTGTVNFTDVANEGAMASYYDAIGWAVANGITAGTGDGSTFSPMETCNRGMMITFLYRLFA